MSGRSLAALFSVFAPVAVCLMMPLPAVGQTTADSSTLPRTAWGAPDLQGIWDLHTITPLERPEEYAGREFLSDEEAAALEARAVGRDLDRFVLGADDQERQQSERDVDTAYNEFWWDRATTVVETGRTSLIVNPPDGKIPALTADAQRRAEVELAHRPLRATGGFEAGRGYGSWEDRSLWERCVTQGLPRIAERAYNANVQVFQTPDYVAIHHEMIHETRIIPIGRPHLEAGVRQWLGDSRGRWEGDTLVVETTNFTADTNFRGATDGLRMVERFTRADADTLHYEVTFDDPTTWTSSWTVARPLQKAEGPIFEYACHEGNYGMEGILAGGRAQEKVAAAAGQTESR
jgi:hypothetical protein